MLLLTRETLFMINRHLQRNVRLYNSSLFNLRCNFHSNLLNSKIIDCKNNLNINTGYQYALQTIQLPRTLTLKNCPLSCKTLVNNRNFHTTQTKYNPIVSIFIRNIAKVVSLFAGRAIRKWWKARTPEEKILLRQFLQRHKWKLFIPIIIAFLTPIVYYFVNIEETPITKRKRFIAFTKKQFEIINKLESEANIHMYHGKLLHNDHPLTQKVGSVVRRILQSNKDQPIIAENDWAVSVIDDDNNINAFVLPSGQIFVFSGLLKICDNDDQLGIVLSHEISHAILLHGIEMMSHAHIVDLIFIGIIGFLWMFLPTDFIALALTGFSRLILRIGLDAPYSRMLETEADEVGLHLAAKACLDIREAAIFWEKMNIIEKEVSGIPNLDLDVEFLMTHPTHEHRAEKLNSMMEKVLKFRECSGCKPLSEVNPKERLDVERKRFIKMIHDKKYDGVLKIGGI